MNVIQLNQTIQNCLQQDSRAQCTLYQFLETKLYPLCRRYSCDHEQAKEFIQVGAIMIFRKLNMFNKKSSFLPWAKTIMTNEIFKTFRKKNVLVNSSDLSDAFDVYGDSSIEIESEIDIQEIKALIKELPGRQQEVFQMYVVDGYSHEEISSQLGCTVTTSRSNLFKAKMTLKKKLLVLGIDYSQAIAVA